MTIPKLEEVCDNAPFHKDNDGGGSTRELYGERIGSYVGTIKREYYDLIKAAPKLYAALRDIVELHENCSAYDCDECPFCEEAGKCDIIEDKLVEAARMALSEAAGLEVQ